MQERTIILYHVNCPDGFGGAYAAWKKFGDTAEYRSLNYGKPLPLDLEGAQVYMIDMCFPQADMDWLAKAAESLVVLDHHEGVEEVARSMPAYVYDEKRSGASIAWSYFHPDTPVPKLIELIEDDDLFLFHNPETQPFMAYLIVQRPTNFETWDAIAQALDDPEEATKLFAKAHIYREYFDLLIAQAAERAKLVNFEGYEVYAGQVHPLKSMVSAFGHLLAEKKPPMALILQISSEGIAVSLRGDGSLDLTTIAKKYGGNGHPSSCAFLVPWDSPLPWTPVVVEEEK